MLKTWSIALLTSKNPHATLNTDRNLELMCLYKRTFMTYKNNIPSFISLLLMGTIALSTPVSNCCEENITINEIQLRTLAIINCLNEASLNDVPRHKVMRAMHRATMRTPEFRLKEKYAKDRCYLLTVNGLEQYYQSR